MTTLASYQSPLQRTPDHLYQTTSTSEDTLSSKYTVAAAAFASSAGLEASVINPVCVARPEELLDSMHHHHIQLQRQQKHKQQEQQEHSFISLASPIQDLGLLSTYDPCSVSSSSLSASMPLTADVLATNTVNSPTMTSTYLSFLPQSPTDPLRPASSLSSHSTSYSLVGFDQDEENSSNNGHYYIDPTSSYGVITARGRRSMPPGPSSSSVSSSKSSSPSASSSLASSPVSVHFDDAAVMLPAITACASCKRSHIKCDSGRPCQNCLKHPSKALTCRDATPKPRGRPKGGSKAAAEAIMLARLYQQQQQQQHQLHIHEQLYRHQQQQQPGFLPRSRVFSHPQQPSNLVYPTPVSMAAPLHQPYPHSQGSLQTVSTSINYQRHPHYSRSSPASPTALERRATRLARRPSLPVWHHPYAVRSSSSSSPPMSPSLIVASSISSGHSRIPTGGTTTATWANPCSSFSSSSLQPATSSMITTAAATGGVALTPIAQEYSHPSFPYPAMIGSSQSIALAQQGHESLSIVEQQQHRMHPLALGGAPSLSTTVALPYASCPTSLAMENSDSHVWHPLQMLQQSLPPSSFVSSSILTPAPSPSSLTDLCFSSANTSRMVTAKQAQSEEREVIKEEIKEDNVYVSIGVGVNTEESRHEPEHEMKVESEEESEEQSCRGVEPMQQKQYVSMRAELQILQQRQGFLHQEQFQQEQALAHLHLQRPRKLHSHSD
ncbi:hypothetical protein FBU30_009121, partial [Linnemannia zychae]